MGMGFFFYEGEEDVDLINVGKQMIIVLFGVVIFDLVMSFVMICGQYIQFIVLGVMEVVDNGDIVNWKIFGKMVKGMGGVMDLVVFVENIIVVMMYINCKGEFKFLWQCILLLMGVCCVKKIVINMVVFDVIDYGFKLIECVFGVMVEEIKVVIEGCFIIEGDILEMQL